MKKLLFTLAWLAFLYGCQKDEIISNVNEVSEENKEIVIKERDPNYPLVISRKKNRPLVENRANSLSFTDCLGRSFKTDFYPFESMENVAYPVIDMEKLTADHSSWISSKGLRRTQAVSFAYSDFNRYSANSNITEKVTTGWNISFGIFKIGNKKTVTNLFSSAITDDQQTVFGQLDVEITDAVHDLHLNSNRLSTVVFNYLDKEFIDDFYNMMPDEVVKDYGSFVLTNFVTGGRATAIYTGRHRETSTGSAQGKEKDMQTNINASFAYKSDSSSIFSSFGFGSGFSNSSAFSREISNFKLSVITLGGSYGHTALTTPQNVDNVSINLSSWANSLNEDRTHTIVDIQNEGLYPIKDFILESNIKKMFEIIYRNGGASSNAKFQEPTILYVRSAPSSLIQPTIPFVIFLRTRFGDLVELINIPWEASPRRRNDESAYLKELTERTGLKIVTNTVPPYGVPVLTSFCEETLMANAPRIPDNDAIKYVDERKGITYILYNKNGKKYGFSIYTGTDDYLLDTYCIRNWVNGLPEGTVTDREILNYTLVAL